MLLGRVDWLKLVAVQLRQLRTLIILPDILNISRRSRAKHSHQFGYVNPFEVWVPQKLHEKNLLDSISTWESLLKRNENVPFLKQIVTGDEQVMQ